MLVRPYSGGVVEVLWDAEYSMSRIPISDVRLKQSPPSAFPKARHSD